MIYKKSMGPGGQPIILRINDDGTFVGFQVPRVGEADGAYLNELYARYKEDVAAGVPVQDADVSILTYSEYRDIAPTRVVTTTATATELARWTLGLRTMYVAQLELEIINLTAANIPVRHIEATITAKRINNGALQVGAVTVKVDQTDVAGAIPVSVAVSGNDFILRVTGVNGQTIHWHLTGEVKIITNDGK